MHGGHGDVAENAARSPVVVMRTRGRRLAQLAADKDGNKRRTSRSIYVAGFLCSLPQRCSQVHRRGSKSSPDGPVASSAEAKQSV